MVVINGDTKLHSLTFLFFFIFLLGVFLVDSTSIQEKDIKRSDFPNGFLFGVATSSYQIEGGYLEDGKSLNNWDAFALQNPGNIRNGDNGFIANDHYHQYLKDIEIIESLGVDAYRFSISWARLLPRGRFGEVNPNGVLFYNKILDNLLLKGIKPFVTIYHHDFPQELQDRYGSWLSPLMQEDYVHYAETCFKYFGDRVKHWTTINEPNLFTEMAYIIGKYPPARCSQPFGNCSAGNSDIEPLIVMHNMLLAHGKARDQGGSVGIVVDCIMYEPLTDDDLDQEAADRGLAFSIGWALDPLIFGDYPSEMRQYLGNQLPRFSNAERKFMANSIDYIAVNHYSTAYVKDCIHSTCSLAANRPINGFLDVTRERDGVPIGGPTGISTLPLVPRGFGEMIGYLKKRYHNKPMFITENGYSEPKGEELQVQDIQQDVKRIAFHKMYLSSLAQAIRDGADVRGYFVWTLMDDFEWILGYTVRFGLYYIDRQTLDRIPKLSARWYQDFLKNNTQTPTIQISNMESKQALKVHILKMAKVSTIGMLLLLQTQNDIEIIESLGVDAYRFSISWARLLPRGRFGEVNPNGVLFYNKILDNLLLKGIKPFVTIYHHDFPQELQDRYGSWLSPLMQEDYVHYAETCFKYFGDRVKHWTTINEPNLFTQMAYINGKYPPARCSQPFGNCSAGNSDIEPLIRDQGGSVGIVVDCLMYEPLTDDDLDQEAAKRGLAFSVGWALDPLIFGDYPSEMRQFSNAERKFMANSIDYIAVNHYSTAYVKDCIHSSCSLTANRPINGFLDVTREREGVPIGEPTGISMLPVVPRGFGEMIGYLKKRYHNKPMFITENGYSEPKGEELQVQDIQQDVKRIAFHKMYLSSLAQAIRDGADVRGYFVWTLMDDFEWILGYTVRFGLYYIDRQTLDRIPKLSARWYQDFLKNNTQTPIIRLSNVEPKQAYS
ncbi:hypothetical protein OSB04_015592 [Centaurea solstitialis]|uniref:Beta-glucosidase n=1 Tax=Centaurea solstitialis TaxID=347529 RepID=A0AA38THK6_9ASTR|nr:hypothetical protein OSB04_015592 [Centaurea solstitialis]